MHADATMDFDDILDEIGEFGRFQITNYLLICLPVLFGAANSLTYVFVAGVPDYRCFVPGCDNPINPNYSASWVPQVIPPAENHDKEFYKPDHCSVYYLPVNNTETCPIDSFQKNMEVRCNEWVYKDNERTIVSEWNITCRENQWKLSLVGTVHFAGILSGSLVFGLLADRFGRKVMLIFSIILMSVSGIAQGLSESYGAFQLFVFINALGTSGIYPLAFTIGVELVGKKKRDMSGMVLNYFYAFGEALVGLIAWLSLDWVIIQLTASAPAMLFVLYYWFLPESVRWLLSRRRHSEAREIIKRAADINGVSLSEHFLSKVEKINTDDKTVNTCKDKPPPFGTFQAIGYFLKSKKLLLRSLNLFFNWASNAFVYYGMSLNSTSLSGNKFLNYALVCLVEIPGYCIAWVAMNRLGRRKSLSGSLLLCSVTCVAAAFVPKSMHWAQIFLFLVGKLGITSSFGILCVFTAELYPTVMRTAGCGASSTVSRVGAMVAPFAPLLGLYMESLPLLVFGSVALVAGCLSLLLPETLGKKLPDTVFELESL